MPAKPKPAGTYAATWGEGPIWWNEALIYVDIEAHKVLSYQPDTEREESWPTGERVGTVVPRINGGFVIAGDNGFSFLDPKSGAIVRIADPEPDKKPDNRFNDGKCDATGRFWAGTISTVKETGDARLYSLETDLSVRERFGPVTNSNGICWSADNQRMFYIDTPRNQVLAFDYEADTGQIANPVAVLDTAKESLPGVPDGMTIDAEGNLWVAMCHGGLVICFDPNTGVVLERIGFPVVETTAAAFGGSDLSTLYVTTGVNSELNEPLGGRLFAVNPGVAGVPAHAFAG